MHKNTITKKKIIKNFKINHSKKRNLEQSGSEKSNSIRNKESNSVDIAVLDTPTYFSKLKPKDKTINWGLGIEHEMHIFHKGIGVAEANFEKSNIMFDSQESTCFLASSVEAKEEQGACQKMRTNLGKEPYYHPTKKISDRLLKGSNKVSSEEQYFLENIDWELSGRQVKDCKGGRMIVPRVPVLMPELVTGRHKNRSIQSIVEEIRFLEDKFIEIQMKNPFTREKVKQYGPLVLHHCGTMGDILVPDRPTIFKKEYNLRKKKWKDYLGSYHITFTLPHLQEINTKDFVKLHERCANQLQWLEPLLVAGFFSPDPDSLGNKKGVEGSFRIVNVGWGNFGGSDVRKFKSEGVNRGSSHETKWRKGFDLKGDKRIKECVKTSKPVYKKSHDILTSDFRTFGFEPDEDKCMKINKETSYDCPRIDGDVMKPPFGMEFRIFDHFPSDYLLDLMKIIILVAANSDRQPPNKYVYNNDVWIKGIRNIMEYGWNARLSIEYIRELRKQLGLLIRYNDFNDGSGIGNNSNMALNVLKNIVNELWEVNKDSMVVTLMDETGETKPNVPSINKDCWELNFNIRHYNNVMKQLRKSKKEGIGSVYVSICGFKKMLFNGDNFKKVEWKHQIEDILYALQSKGRVELKIVAGNINKIKLLF